MTITPQTRNASSRQSTFSEMLDVLRSRMRIAVVYGGDRNQDGAVVYRSFNPRPWKSYEPVANNICEALTELGFQHVVRLRDDMTLPQRIKDEGIHFAWLNTGGVQGYSPVSHASAMLEMLGVPYVGHLPHNVSLLDNKDTFKHVLQSLGIPTAPFIAWHPDHGPLDMAADGRFRRAFEHYDGPFVVKPVSGRASLNITLVDSIDELPLVAGDLARRTHNTVVIETFLSGREFCVAVCGGTLYKDGALVHQQRPFTFATIERILQPDEAIFTSMDTRPITAQRLRGVAPQEPEHSALTALGRTLYAELRLTSLIRVDIRADDNGILHVLEANPKPDLAHRSGTTTSLIAAQLAESGMTYTDLIMSLLSDRLDRLFLHSPESVRHLAELLHS